MARGKHTGSVQQKEALVAECSGINLYSEYSLHAQLKEILAKPGDRLEARVSGKVVDLVREDGELVEVQTGHVGQIAPKVLGFAEAGYKVRVVHPVAVRRDIRRLDPKTGELLSTRRSPKKGDVYSLFDELVRATSLIAAPRVTVEVLLVHSVEIKTRDGSGSWWKRGDRTLDRELAEILDSRSFRTKAQWLGLIPKGLPQPWTSASLAEALGIASERSRKILYCLSKAGLLKVSGKAGQLKVYEKA